MLIATADLKKNNAEPKWNTHVIHSVCLVILPSVIFRKKKKKKSCSASAVSALGGDSCPSVPYKAPHLGAWSQSQHMEL